ncbi:MAG: toxin, partial [Gemmatimonadetes bacterium]|nr:toxin [Gemmatimonadota bacterium]
MAAARSRVASAERDLLIHEKSIAQNQEVDEFLRDKFTGEGLYQWMAGRLSSLYFQTYRMALDASLSAQTAWQFERGRGDTFVDFSYWDSMRKGLLAAEGLRLALDRMDALTGTVDTRALEIERTVSLASLNPLALQALRTHGVCDFDLPEVMYDYDYPGQYMRRIKNVSLSIPAVVGPYQNLKATLTQTKNVVVLKDDIAAVRFLLTGKGSAPAGTLREDWAPHQQVAVSRGVDDSGLFVVDFHDERYLPFEGTGAVSSWRLEMPKETNHFDFDQLTDVVVTVRYTARPSATLRPQVETELATLPMTLGYYIDARQAYPVDWTAFMRDHSDPAAQTLSFTFTPEWRGFAKSLVLDEVMIRLATRDVTWPAAASFATLTIGTVAKTPEFVHGIADLTGLNLPREVFTGTWK